MPHMTIDVCICTYQREHLCQTLESVIAQQLDQGTAIRIIVADNDEQPSAAAYVARISAKTDIPIQYIHAPARNISIARNACLEAATADWLAFIDDDEVAAPDWLASLLKAARQQNLTAVFGPIHAKYEDTTPEWIRIKDYHSSFPERRQGKVETGHAGSALVRRADPAVIDERFEQSKGLTGGEDTDYFFRIGRNGGKFGICNEAKVYEEVEPGRLNLRWLARRKFRYGQSYGIHAAGHDQTRRMVIVTLALAKVVFCAAATILFIWSASERNYWLLRGIFHAGVIASFLGIKEQAHY